MLQILLWHLVLFFSNCDQRRSVFSSAFGLSENEYNENHRGILQDIKDYIGIALADHNVEIEELRTKLMKQESTIVDLQFQIQQLRSDCRTDTDLGHSKNDGREIHNNEVRFSTALPLPTVLTNQLKRESKIANTL